MKEKSNLLVQWNEEMAKKYCLYARCTFSQFISKCLTCGYTGIRRISATEKAVNIGMFGFFGNKRRCQFECLNPASKYKW